MIIDARDLANPYAPAVLIERELDLGVPADRLVVTDAASKLIRALLAGGGPVLLTVPTFSAYAELTRGRIINHRLRPANDFALDLDELAALVARHRPSTVVISTPNDATGRTVDPNALFGFLMRTAGHVEQVIVDERFAHFSTEGTPPTAAHLVDEFPHLVVVNSLEHSHGVPIAYAVTAPQRASRFPRTADSCQLLTHPEYEHARRTYVREIQAFRAGLATLPGAKAFPGAANFALITTYRPASDVAAELFADHGIAVRECTRRHGFECTRYLSVAARTAPENEQIVTALRHVLTAPLSLAA